MKAFILALCMLVVPSIALASNHDNEECFASAQQLRQVHKNAYYKWKQTPNGMCYHLGYPRQKTVSHVSKPLPAKAGGGGYTKAEPVPHQHLIDIDAAISYYSKHGGRDLIDFMFGR